MTLPIHAVLDDLLSGLASHTSVVLEAPPGAGKTTVVPPALLDADWLANRRVVMLEPRRLAAKNAARFMASALGEKPGGTIGYRVRLESCVSERTRIEVVTEGVLTRMLQEDPALEDVGIVIFDEFHERNLQADLGLALALDARDNLREDLRILIMSATLDGVRISEFLDDAPVVRTEGRQYPVDTRHAPAAGDDIANSVATAARELMAGEPGSLLAFLPGAGEIRRAAKWLEERLPPDIMLAPLFGDLPPGEQDRAIRPAGKGTRKLVLATNIAESSLTIEGVRLVVDCGLERAPVFDPPSGMTRLVTRQISQASADQRRGRAGRMEPGVCMRLWREADTSRMRAHIVPEILSADLAPLALELAGWGVTDIHNLRWLDLPPVAALEQARTLLAQLEAIDETGRITPTGREMLALPVHPRLAHMLLKGREKGIGALAVAIATILEARDPLSRTREADIDLRVRALATGEGISRGQWRQLQDSAKQLARRLGIAREYEQQCREGFREPERAGFLVAEAFPDRVAQRRPGAQPRYRMAGGRGAALDEADGLAASEWLAVANVSGAGREGKIFLAAELHPDDVAALEAEAGETVQVAFDVETRSVSARRVKRVGALVLESQAVPVPRERALPVLLRGIREHGVKLLPWSRETQAICERVETLRRISPEEWPACDESGLLADLERWLAPFLDGVTSLRDVSPATLREALVYRVGHERVRELDVQAPEHFELPSGQRARIDYSGDVPVLAARIQQFFGLHRTPSIAGGRLPLMLQLLSPANRPMQVTRDLASFWKNTYPEVRKDLRGRYPKHAWPEDPWSAEPLQPRRRKP